jgi:tetratricopeptide (TPR) repeat protein
MTGDERVAIMTLAMLAEIRAELGRFNDAMATAQRAFARGEAINHIVIRSLTRQAQARIYINQREWQQAFDIFQESLSLLAQSDNQWTRLMFGAMLAETYLQIGKTELARETINESLARAQFAGSPHSEGWSRRVKGQIFTAQGFYDDARVELDRAIELLAMTGSRLELARAYEKRGILNGTVGEMSGAAADEEKARKIFAECGVPV